MSKVLILLGSDSDLTIAEKGLDFLKKAKIPFELKISSAHRSPNLVEENISNFDRDGGSVIICVAGMSAHLAGVVAGLTVKPVIAVPVARSETAGLDSLLSVSQMPGGIPVATMGLGKSGFTNACILATEIIGVSDVAIVEFLKLERKRMVEVIKETNSRCSIEYKG